MEEVKNKSARRMFSKISDDFVVRALIDLTGRINSSRETLQNADDRALFHRFWMRLNGGKKMGAVSRALSPSDLLSESDMLWGPSALFGTFYLSHYDQCPEDREFPNPCQYEVIIPYAEINDDLIKVYVVPSGLRDGDRAFTFSTVLPANPPEEVPLREMAHVPALDFNKLQKLTNRLTPPRLIQAAQMGVGVHPFPKGPHLRFGCYNVPWQCAYELGSSYVGDYWRDGLDLLKMVETNVKLAFEPFNHSRLFICMSYPMWNMAGLMDKEMHECVNQMERSCGLTESFRTTEAFIKARDRMFRNFLRKNYPKKVAAKAN